MSALLVVNSFPSNQTYVDRLVRWRAADLQFSRGRRGEPEEEGDGGGDGELHDEEEKY